MFPEMVEFIFLKLDSWSLEADFIPSITTKCKKLNQSERSFMHAHIHKKGV